ncbi:MAG: NACHT domain-containing protein [Chloroflexi bacterium]|nr:NACHT domain-containing protein [Chloroflexota bacterium]
MNKRTLLIVAGLILLLTAVALAVNWFLQPILPSPWDNIALIVFVTIGLVVAFLDNLTAVITFIHNWLYPPPQPPPSGPTIWNNIKTEGGDSIGRDKITAEQVIILADRAADDFWRTYRRPAQPNIQAATSRYLQFIINRYQFLDFKGMGVTDRAAFGLPLLQVYVPLKARPEMPAGETWSRATRLAGHLLGEAELMGQMGMRPSHEPHPALDLLRENDGLIILGDPGSGKSTFLKILALQHAFGKQGETGLGLRLPVLLPLAAYAKALVEEDVPLHKFMAAYYQRLGMDAALGDLLTEALQQGGALLLLDGLDEVREPNLRQTVVERVMSFFAFHQQNGNKFVLTSRIVGYKDVRPSGTRLAECTLEDFDNEEITQFVDQWTAAIEQQATADPTLAAQQAQQEKETLLYSVRHNGGVRKLAANPLLLTILALMKRQGVVLPERRVELYDKYLETLLKSWNLARSLDGRPTTRDLDVAETIRVLAPLALWMHETSPSMGVVRRQALHQQLEQIYTTRQAENPAQAAQKLLEDAREYAGLLVERGADEYGFVHLTFQEYLAAVAMAQQAQGDARPVATQLAQHLHQDTWREVSLLTIGYIAIRQQLDTVASDVLLQLLQPASAPLTINHSQFTIHNSQALILVGESLTDIGSANVTPLAASTLKKHCWRADRPSHPRQRQGTGGATAGQTG